MNTNRIAQFLAAILVFAALSISSSAQLSQTTLSGYIHDQTGVGRAGIEVFVVKTLKDGQPVASVQNKATSTTGGAISLTIVRGSTIYLYSPDVPAWARNGRQGVPYAIPDSATYSIENLAALSSVYQQQGDTAPAGPNGRPVRVAGNTADAVKFYGQIGTAGVAGTPGWWTITGSGLSATQNNTTKTLTLGYTPTASELLAAFGTQTANTVLAGPTTGSAAVPTWRALVAADIPNLSSVYQPLDSELTAIAALSPSNDDIIQRKGGTWTNRTIAQVKSDFGLATIATSGSASDLGSGTVPTAQLGSGTANSTTYLRGDSTWATVVAGTTINSTNGAVPYRLDLTTFADSPITRIDASTVQVAAINGGSAANDDLILQGTSNATRTSSYVVLQPNGGNVGIGIISPAAAKLEVSASFQVANFTLQSNDANWGGVRYGWEQADGSLPFGITIGGYNAGGNKIVRFALDGVPSGVLFEGSNYSFSSKLAVNSGVSGAYHSDLPIDLNFNSLGGYRAIKFRYNDGANTAMVVGEDGRVGINSSPPAAQLDVRPSSTSTIGQIIRLASGQTANALNIENSTGTFLSGFLASGALRVVSLADVNAPTNSIYYSTTASKLVFKDAGGTVNALY